MTKIYITLLFLGTTLLITAQNPNYCDSLFIKCCTYDSVMPNSLTIYAANHSPVLFNYPGFILIDENSDTIAKETVNYFGIGTGYQPHTLQYVNPLELPFEGELLLFGYFYDSLLCQFPFSIADTVISEIRERPSGGIILWPNPVSDRLFIKNIPGNAEKIQVLSLDGKAVLTSPILYPLNGISMQEIENRGLYLIQILDRMGEVVYADKIIYQP
ncbi:MAG: T9SS type A sorting domain-containing protein [Bacteroidales bacterium]|nr:T9SS type A sorting domain-containing protein [Bacteroidales bacterium]